MNKNRPFYHSNWLLFALTILLTAKVVLFINYFGVNVLYLDQWGFLNPMFKEEGIIAFTLYRHAAHLMGLGGITLYITNTLSGWNTIVDGYLVLFFLVLSTILGIAIKRNIYGGRHWSDLLVPVLFLTISQGEIFIQAPDPAPSSLTQCLVLLLAYLVLLNNKVVSDYLIGITFILCFTTGYAMFATPFVIIYLVTQAFTKQLTQRRIISQASAFILFGVGVAIYLIAGNQKIGPNNLDNSAVPFSDFIVFIFNLLTSYFSGKSHETYRIIIGTTFFILCLPLIFKFPEVLKFWRSKKIFAGLVLLGFSLVFITLTTIARVNLGTGAANAPRYITDMGILLFLFILAYQNFFKNTRLSNVVLFLFLILCVTGEILYFIDTFENNSYVTQKKKAWVRVYKETEDIRRTNEITNFELVPNSKPEYFKEKMQYLKEHKLNFYKE